MVGLLAKGMYITSHGSFCVRGESGREDPWPAWFASDASRSYSMTPLSFGRQETERFTGEYHFFAEAMCQL